MWKPIETLETEKDEQGQDWSKTVLLLGKRPDEKCYIVEVGCLQEGEWADAGRHHGELGSFRPVYWMPIPDLPSDAKPLMFGLNSSDPIVIPWLCEIDEETGQLIP